MRRFVSDAPRPGTGLLALVAVLEQGVGEEALRSVVRGTARVAVTLSSLTFATSSLHAFRHSGATEWLLANRRFLGLSFALAHADHLLPLLALAFWLTDRFFDGLDSQTLIGGGLAYALLFAMVATSSDAAFRRLGATLAGSSTRRLVLHLAHLRVQLLPARG
jgi:DMSO/TMAO reductase YedYZ heme-binding membrane subunit